MPAASAEGKAAAGAWLMEYSIGSSYHLCLMQLWSHTFALTAAHPWLLEIGAGTAMERCMHDVLLKECLVY